MSLRRKLFGRWGPLGPNVEPATALATSGARKAVTGSEGSASLMAIATGLFALTLWAPQPAAGKVFLTRGEALALAFPGCQVEREAKLAGVRVDSRLVVRYKASCGGAAYFDVHRVRTLAETLMVVVDADGHVRQLEIMAFLEPEEYIPRRNWYEQFLNRRLNPRVVLKRSIHAVTGATLTARATTDAVRRVLALDQVLGDSPPPTGRLVP